MTHIHCMFVYTPYMLSPPVPFPRVKSPPCNINPLMMRWKEQLRKWSGLPEEPSPFSPVHKHRKFSTLQYKWGISTETHIVQRNISRNGFDIPLPKMPIYTQHWSNSSNYNAIILDTLTFWAQHLQTIQRQYVQLLLLQYWCRSTLWG